MADPGAFDRWLSAYARAQDGGDVALLKSLFSEQAQFCETPFNKAIEGAEEISRVFARNWARMVDSSFTVEKITEGWAHWSAGGVIAALEEPHRTDGILKADLDAEGRCCSLVFWTERLSVRESDMLAQRDA